MDCKILINSIGIILSVIGTYVAFLYSPQNYSGVDEGDSSTDYNAIENEVKIKNEILKPGVYIIMVGAALQLISQFI